MRGKKIDQETAVLLYLYRRLRGFQLKRGYRYVHIVRTLNDS